MKLASLADALLTRHASERKDCMPSKKNIWEGGYDEVSLDLSCHHNQRHLIASECVELKKRLLTSLVLQCIVTTAVNV